MIPLGNIGGLNVSNSNGSAVGNNGASSTPIINTLTESVPRTEPATKKRKFSLKDHVTIEDPSLSRMDEVSRYNSIYVSSMDLNHELFLTSQFAVVAFWYATRKSFLALYSVAMRVCATSPSSSAFQRVSSTVNKII